MSRHVWLIANSFTRWLWVPLACRLEDITGLRPVILLPSAQDERYYAAQLGADRVIFKVLKDPYDVIAASPVRSLPDLQTAKRLRELEDMFDVSVMREMILPDRHIGRGYMLAGEGHPESHTSRNASFGAAMEACLEQFDYTEELFAQLPPAAVLCYYGGGGLRYKPIVTKCRREKIPFRAFCPARFGGLAYWAHDEYENSPILTRALQETEALPEAEAVEAILREVAPSALATDPEALRRLRKMSAWPTLLKRSVRLVAERVHARLRGYNSSRTGYLVTSSIAMMLRMRRHWRQLDRLAVRDLSGLAGRKVVYYPLQQEPEASTLVLSPSHTNQLYTITELSLSLPPDCVLVVKEHIWQIGRRPDWFYAAICKLPNVTLVHPEAPGLEMVRRADVVATITSSAGFEAAAFGKKVIFFWERCPLAALPYVMLMPRLAGLEGLRALLADDNPEQAQLRRRQGAQFLQKLRRTCIDVAPMKFFSRTEAPNQTELELLLQPLLDEQIFSIRAAN